MRYRFNLNPGRRFVAGATLAATVASQLAITPAGAVPPPQAGGIRFAVQVPVVTAPLPLYKLTSSAAPSSFVAGALGAIKAPPLVRSHNLLLSRDNNALRAVVDLQRGDAEILPDLSQSTGQGGSTDQALKIAGSIFARPDIIPRDATTSKLGLATPVSGAGEVTNPPGVPPTQIAPTQRFIYVPALRFASNLPVYGQGSHAVVAIGNDGTVRGLVRRWRSAAPAGSVTPTLTAKHVTREIVRQLQPFAQPTVAITVDRILQAYYDSDGKFMQPVYYFSAILQPVDGKTGNDRVAGYVAVGKLAEKLPVLGAPSKDPAPVTPQTGGSASRRGLVPNGGTPVSLGEYANRDGSMLGMANELLTGFDSVPWFLSLVLPPIVRTQWYWAYSWLYVGGSANSYVNAVQIAYTQPHGDWYVNTTDSNCCDAFYVNNIGTGGNPGYGAAAGGNLATWIVDSCEVLPAYYDLLVTTSNGYNAFNNWWPVFQGLHNAIGFRTQMWLFDGLNQPFGYVASLGGDVNSAWFNEIAAAPAYNDGYTYLDTHLGQMVHMGRASTFIDARNLGQSIYNVAPQSPAGTLWNFWMNN